MRHWLPCSIATILLLVGRDGSLSAQTAAPQFEFVSVRRVPPLCCFIELNLKCTRQMAHRVRRIAAKPQCPPPMDAPAPLTQGTMTCRAEDVGRAETGALHVLGYLPAAA